MSARRILVVEDEFLIATEISRVLQGAGWEVVGPAGTFDEALKLAREAVIDGALLDANLDGRSADDIAHALCGRSVPFVWVSGYGLESLPETAKGAGLLGKPFNTVELLAAVQLLVGE